MRILALVILCTVPLILSAQVANPVQQGWGELTTIVKTNNGTAIVDRTFTSVSTDTTEWIPTVRGKSFWLLLSAKDSCSVLPKYQLSHNGVNPTDYAVSTDSLKVTNQAYHIRAVNVSTPADSASYIRFLLQFSTSAYAKGTTTPTYTAQYSIKRN
jgi:hypothetical protein